MVTKIVKRTEFEKKKGISEEIKNIEKHHAVDVDSEKGGIIDKNTLKARDRAESIITDAENEASKIKQHAQKILEEVESVREKAKKEGFVAGESKGFSQLTEKIVRFDAIREKFYKDAEPEIIKLVTAIAEKVIGQIVEEKPEVIRDVVHKALERSLGDRITVRINPEDYKTITSSNFEFRDVLDRAKRLHFKEDESITKGGCVVETEVGTIDAQIGTQMEAIRKALEI